MKSIIKSFLKKIVFVPEGFFESVSNQDLKSREPGYRQSVISYHDNPTDNPSIVPVHLATPYP